VNVNTAQGQNESMKQCKQTDRQTDRQTFNNVINVDVSLFISVVPDFGSGKSRIPPFSEIRATLAPVKFLAIFGRCQRNCQIITDKTNAADLSSGVFSILISVTRMKKSTKLIAVPQMLSKTGS